MLHKFMHCLSAYDTIFYLCINCAVCFLYFILYLPPCNRGSFVTERYLLIQEPKEYLERKKNKGEWWAANNMMHCKALTFFSCQFSTFRVSKKDRSGVCLETSDGLWTAWLTDKIHSLTHTHSDRQTLNRFIKCDQEARIHGSDKWIQQVVEFAKDN